MGFLHVLTNADADGRLIVDAAGGTLTFVLLNAAAHFTKVCTVALLAIRREGSTLISKGAAVMPRSYDGSCQQQQIRRQTV